MGSIVVALDGFRFVGLPSSKASQLVPNPESHGSLSLLSSFWLCHIVTNWIFLSECLLPTAIQGTSDKFRDIGNL